jgi:hypothetical protein
MPPASLDYKKTLLVVLTYIGGFFLLHYVLHITGFFTVLPNNENLLHWDAAWYDSIAYKGYIYWDGQPNNCGFYFLFPLLWKLTGFFGFSISVLNALLFALGVAIIANIYRPTLPQLLLWISTPSMFFMFVPYAEALFFLLSAICFYGIVKQKVYLVWISLFLISLTRANAIIFIPVFLMAEVLMHKRSEWLKSLKTGFVYYALPLLAGVAVFILYQYMQSGVWFAYYKLQAEFWGREFSLPAFPLQSMWGNKFLWLNALALFLGFFSLIALIRIFIDWLSDNLQPKDKLLLVSLLYFAGTLFLILFFNPKWGNNKTNVFGAHRYMLANPFLFVFLYHYAKSYKWTGYVFVLVAANVFWFLFGSYEHIQKLLYYSMNTALILAYMVYNYKKTKWLVWLPVLANIMLQLWMFQSFLIPGNFPD